MTPCARDRLGAALMLSTTLFVAFTTLSLLAPFSLQGQVIPEDEIRWGSQPFTPLLPGAIQVQTNLVEVGVVVRDGRGKVVEGLTQNDFEIYDQGKKQRIALFSLEGTSRTTAAAPA